MKRQYLSAFLTLVAAALLCVPMVQARAKKGDKYLKQGQAAEGKGDWDAALSLYQEAVEENPTDPSYLIAMRRARFQAGQKHVDAGLKLRTQGKVKEALDEFQRGFVADPASGIAIQEIKRTREMLNRPVTGAKPEDAGLTDADRARKESDRRVSSMLPPPELKPIIRRLPDNLKMNNQPPKVLFDTVGKLGGVNIVWDSQFSDPGKRYNVDLASSTVEQAFDYLALITHTFWKAVSPNTIFVAEDNANKRRDYEDVVVRVFFLTNTTSTQEFIEATTAIRTATNIRQAFTFNAQKAFVVRGTADSVALAEKLVHDLDRPKAEVVTEVIVMEANSSRTRDLAATLATATSSGLTAGLSAPISFTPRNGITTGSGTTTGTTGGTTTTTTSNSTAITLANLGRISTGDFSTTLPGALLQAVMGDSRTKILSSPQVRSSDGLKATLNIGDKVPYATGAFQSALGVAGASAGVQTQFQYIDTGVTVDITPQVHNAEEVTLHVEINVSAVKNYVNLGGLPQPVISQNKATADLRMRAGEVNILSGLSSSQDSTSMSGIPGLYNIPLLGKLFFGSNHTEKDRGELLIAFIPHIVRTPDYSPESLRGIYSGNDTNIKLNYAAQEDAAAGPVAGGTSAVVASPGPNAAGPTPVPNTPVPNLGPGQLPTAVQPVPVTPVQGMPTPNPAIFGQQPQPDAVPPGAQQPGAQATVGFMPATMQIMLSAPFPLAVSVNNSTDLFSVSPMHVRFDPAVLRLSDIVPGDLLTRDGGRVTTVKDIRNDTGEATLTITRLPGSAGVTGSGSVATLNFVAVGKGTTSITVTELGLKNSQLSAIPVMLGSSQVTVQ